MKSFEDLVPATLARRLERAGEFTMHVTRPDGHIAQIGDNDSGRLFKLQPAYSESRLDGGRQVLDSRVDYVSSDASLPLLLEESLDHRHLANAIGTLFDRRDLVSFAHPYILDGAVIRAMIGRFKFRNDHSADPLPKASSIRVRDDSDFATIERALPQEAVQRYRFSAPGVVPGTCELFGYPDFGIYLIRGPRLFLAIRCGPVGQAGNGGHAHNDQLAVELVIDGKTIARDPGTYLYTPLPNRRNEYRSVQAHFAPQIDGGEPAALAALFSLTDTTKSQCLYFGTRGFAGSHRGYGRPVYRIVAIEDEAIEVRDYADSLPLARCRFSDDGGGRFATVAFSPGYGLREADA